jgi:hypothetical protein
MDLKEKRIRDFVRPHILRGRDGDWKHACRVVAWVKQLGKGRKDLLLLIASGYIHDIGWRDVLPPQKLTLDKLLQYEEQANKNSNLNVREVLTNLGFEEEEINKSLRLVRAADEHKSNADDEAIIVDSDNLSKLDINHLREKFEKKEWRGLLTMWSEELPNRIKTKEGKKVYKVLLNNLEKEINKQLSPN